ncbi:MAG: hypothetical protein ACQGVC_20490 [Myxococcota bacterium]
MDLQALLADKGPEWIGLLMERAGMSREQADTFLPVAVKALSSLSRGDGLDLSSLLGGADLGALLGRVDTGALAGQTGVDPATAEQGLAALAPEVLGSLAGGDAGGLLGAAGGLSKKLFG